MVTVDAAIDSVTGREFMAADRELAGITWRITLREIPGVQIEPSWRGIDIDSGGHLMTSWPSCQATHATTSPSRPRLASLNRNGGPTLAKIKSDAHLYLTGTGDPEPTPVAVTSITNMLPAVVTLAAAAPADTANGRAWIVFADTGQPLLDGKAFRIQAFDAAVPGTPTFELYGLDGTKLTAAVATGTAQIWTKAGLTGLEEVCLVNITVAGVAPDSIAMDDMCGSTTVLGSPKPPTFNVTGFVDAESPGFRNLMQASLESPKTPRWMLIDYTTGGGYIFGPVEIAEVTITAQTAQGLQFSGSGVYTEMPTYSWAL